MCILVERLSAEKGPEVLAGPHPKPGTLSPEPLKPKVWGLGFRAQGLGFRV